MQVEFSGRLGNQMFEYAFLKELEYKYPNYKVFADFQTYKDKPELLDVFNVDVEESSKKMRYKVLPFKISKLLNCSQWLYLSKPITEETFDEAKVTDRSYFQGFWQREYYFQDVIETIKKDFSFKEIKDLKNKQCMEKIKKSNSVSIHIRRGDYLYKQNRDFFISLSDTNYYKKAIQIAKEKDSLFFIFSDDIEWCKKEFNFLNAVFVDWNCDGNSWIDMFLMSMCKKTIIANSSFSWWAGYLNSNGIIYCPKTFYYGSIMDRCPKTWNSISFDERQ